MARHRVDTSRIAGEPRAMGGKKGGDRHSKMSVDKPRGDAGRKGSRAGEGKGAPDRAAPVNRRRAGGDAFNKMTEGNPVGALRDRSTEPTLFSKEDLEIKQGPARRKSLGQTKATGAAVGGSAASTPPTPGGAVPPARQPARKAAKGKMTPARGKKGGKEV